jgi:SAM-dependent methyltransferase
VGIDRAEQQIAQARRAALEKNLVIDWRVARCEELPFADDSFDVVTANMCWNYFDKTKVVPELRRVLKRGGYLVISFFHWERSASEVVRLTESLAAKYNPAWAHQDARAAMRPTDEEWMGRSDLDLCGYFKYREAIRFTKEAWRGRLRASRSIGPSVNEAQVEAFDRELQEGLGRLPGDEMLVPHTVSASILQSLKSPA